MAMVTAEWVLCLQQRSTSDRISMPVSAQVPPSCRRHNLIARVPPLLVDQSIEQDERHNETCLICINNGKNRPEFTLSKKNLAAWRLHEEYQSLNEKRKTYA